MNCDLSLGNLASQQVLRYILVSMNQLALPGAILHCCQGFRILVRANQYGFQVTQLGTLPAHQVHFRLWSRPMKILACSLRAQMRLLNPNRDPAAK